MSYTAHTSTVRTLILQLFLGHNLVNLKPFLRYPPSIVHRQYFIIISFEKKVYAIFDTIGYLKTCSKLLGWVLEEILRKCYQAF